MLRRPTHQDPPADARYAAALAEAAAAPGLRKGERTRLLLLAAMARRLADPAVEPGDLRIADVTGDAGVALGTFYRHFAERDAALAALADGFAGFLGERLAAARDGAAGSRERVLAVTLAYVRHVRANPGLMRCLLGLDRASAAWSASFRKLNRAWNGRVAAALAGARGGKPADLLPTAYALGGMVDEFLAALYLRRDPALAALRRNEAAVAELLTELWWRAARPDAGPAPPRRRPRG